jgi:hypothetical protein
MHNRAKYGTLSYGPSVNQIPFHQLEKACTLLVSSSQHAAAQVLTRGLESRNICFPRSMPLDSHALVLILAPQLWCLPLTVSTPVKADKMRRKTELNLPSKNRHIRNELVCQVAGDKTIKSAALVAFLSTKERLHRVTSKPPFLVRAEPLELVNISSYRFWLRLEHQLSRTSSSTKNGRLLEKNCTFISFF